MSNSNCTPARQDRVVSSEDTGQRHPHGAVQPGSYNGTWNLDGREVPGTVELAGGRFPHGTATFIGCSTTSGGGRVTPRVRDATVTDSLEPDPSGGVEA